MKKRTAFLLTCALLLSLLILPSCSNNTSVNSVTKQNDDTLTVKIPTQIIYADSAGELYFINVKSEEYSHTIGAVANSYLYYFDSYYYSDVILHSFTKDAPKTFQGFTVSVTRTPLNQPTEEQSEEEDASTVPMWEDPFTRLTVAPGTVNPAKKLVKVFDKQTLFTALENPSALSAFCSCFSVGSFPSSGIEWSDQQQRFADNNALDETLTINNDEYHIVIKLEEFTYKDKVEQDYVFSTDYLITKIPYYDSETGKLTAHQVKISVASLTGSSYTTDLTYFEYE